MSATKPDGTVKLADPERGADDKVMMGSAWDIANPTIRPHDGTVDFEYMVYENHGADVTGRTDYRLWSTDTESFFLPESAVLEVKFRVKSSANGNASSLLADQQRALASCGWYLFEDARLVVQDQELAHVVKPGKVAHMHMLLHSDRTHIQSVQEQSHIYIDEVSDAGSVDLMNRTTDGVASGTITSRASAVGSYYENIYDFRGATAGPGSTGVFFGLSATANTVQNIKFDPSFKSKVDRQVAVGTDYQTIRLPLKQIFPLLETGRVIKGSKFEIQLNKISNVKEALYHDNGAVDSEIIINRVRLFMARVRPSFDTLAKVNIALKNTPKVEHVYEHMKLYSYPYPDTSSGEKVFQLVTKQNKPTKVVIGFQFSSRSQNEKLNPLKYDLLGSSDSCLINRIELHHNGKRVPNIVYDPSTDYTRILDEIYRVGNVQQDDAHAITHKNWKTMYPLFVFDCSQLEGTAYETRTQSVLELFWTLSDSPPSNYTVFALVYSEMKATYNYSDGTTTIRTS